MTKTAQSHDAVPYQQIRRKKSAMNQAFTGATCHAERSWKPILKLINFSNRFGKAVAVSSISFDASEGKFSRVTVKKKRV